MGGFYINVHVRADDPAPVRREINTLFQREGFASLGDQPASVVVEDENALPEGEDWYGVIVSGRVGKGWVSVYVDDWQDSGVVALGLSQTLAAPVLEVWVADDAHWGYTFYENGNVSDRFADDPDALGETPEEAAAYAGRAEALATILQVTPERFAEFLQAAQAEAGQFAGGPIDGLTGAVGLPFEHAFTAYEYFFEDDPDDFASDLEDWPQFRHLAFRHPQGRDRLAE